MWAAGAGGFYASLSRGTSEGDILLSLSFAAMSND